MLRMLVAVAAWSLAALLHAAPIDFTNAGFETTAVAAAEGVADFETDASPPTPLPLISEAVVAGASDVAIAGALGADGLLSASADVTSTVDIASAVATALFTGTLAGQGSYRLFVDFDAIAFATGTGTGSVTLLVTLTRDGTTLLDELLTAATSLEFGFALPANSSSELALLLVSEAEALGATGAAFSQGIVEFRAEVPLLPTHAFVALGLVVLAATRRRQRR